LSQNSKAESTSWLLATIIMALIALTIFFVQHFVTQIFDTAVEISIFYIPAAVLVVLYLKRRWSAKSSR
jgi:uncharacterized membrane protein